MFAYLMFLDEKHFFYYYYILTDVQKKFHKGEIYLLTEYTNLK